ncbi:hypothetical protein [Geomonas propionica]|uniref:Uncharacterized protein n=1 Tax=Geomonas propionica TaxID=2798582 RepID=A0ABS0YVN2_9BACT|nr:hypothetical protein [Geomonas propionica]MBJ6802030.1 hypothetical protein [Geomonas propionica]
MKVAVVTTLLLIWAGSAGAEELICRGNIVSTQGEGIVARKHRFEVADVTGDDVQAVLEKCKKIALERQARAARKNPGGNFTSTSDVELQCVKGAEKIEVRRRLPTR